MYRKKYISLFNILIKILIYIKVDLTVRGFNVYDIKNVHYIYFIKYFHAYKLSWGNIKLGEI